MWLWIGFGVLQCGLLAMSGWAARVMGGFLRRYDRIDGDESMAAYRAVVRWNMRAALGQGLIFLPYIGVGVALVWVHGWPGLALVLAGNAVNFGLALLLRGYEKRIRFLPAAGEWVDQQRHIVESWRKRVLPDF